MKNGAMVKKHVIKTHKLGYNLYNYGYTDVICQLIAGIALPSRVELFEMRLPI